MDWNAIRFVWGAGVLFPDLPVMRRRADGC